MLRRRGRVLKMSEEEEYNEILDELVKKYREYKMEYDFTPYSSHQAEGDKMVLAAEARKILDERKVERAKPQWVVEKNRLGKYRARLGDEGLYGDYLGHIRHAYAYDYYEDAFNAIEAYKKSVVWEVVDE